MELPQDVVEDATRRLRRVHGQIGGIIGMLESGRECRDVVQQLSAASTALDRAGFRLLASGLRYCVTNADEAEGAGYDSDELERLFMQLT